MVFAMRVMSLSDFKPVSNINLNIMRILFLYQLSLLTKCAILR